MILRPVRPQSATGPPSVNGPAGLMCKRVAAVSQLPGITGLMISSRTASRTVSSFTSGKWCVDNTIASTATGEPAAS